MTENTRTAWSARAAFPAPWDAALWSRAGQTARFQAVTRHLHLRDGDSVLDYGCGPGELSAWLPTSVRYFAHDTSPGMLARVGRNHPRAILLPELPDELFDHVVCVGPFNLAHDWSREQTWEAVARLWLDHTRRALLVSLYRGDDPDCIAYTPAEAAAFADAVGCKRHLVDASFLDNDLLLVMSR